MLPRAAFPCALAAVVALMAAAATAQQPVDATSAATPAEQDAARSAVADPLISSKAADGHAAVPRMLGDQLFRSNSVNFVYETVASNPNIAPGVAGGFFLNLRDTKVATNNCAVPIDNFSYDFSSFNHGNVVGGVSGQTAPSGLSSYSPGQKHLTQAVAYDIGWHTFAYEKSFADGRFSLEARLPFADGLCARQDLSAGKIMGDQVDPNFGTVLAIDSTPQSTWGSAAWELQDISLILKVKLYEAPARNLCFSGGLQVVAPTARNSHAEITDYWSPFNEFGGYWPVFDAWARRTRTLDVSNHVWTLSPFVALSLTPTPRTFCNAFLQLDVPLGANTVSYAQTYESQNDENTGYGYYHVQPITSINGQAVPGEFTGTLHDQVLTQLDLGFGYWLYQDPTARWVKGVAPILEMHLTQTLQKGEVLQLPQVGLYNFTAVVPSGQTTVGSTAPNTTLTDLTFGINTEIGTSSTLAVGATMPLGSGTNRSFDSEVLVRFNHAF